MRREHQHRAGAETAMPSRTESYFGAGARGAVAGTIACVVQTAVGWVLSNTLLPAGQDNNLAPRLVHQTARIASHQTSPATDWLLGTLFHVGYGLGWGSLFGVLRRWTGWPSGLLGSAVAGTLYALQFTRFGVGTPTGTQAAPERRPWEKQVSLVTLVLPYAFSLAILFDRLPRSPRRPVGAGGSLAAVAASNVG